MAKPGRKGGHKKSGGKDWVKGQSGNPAGRAALGDVHKLKEQSKKDVIRALCEALESSYSELELDSEDKTLPASQLLAVNLVKKAIDIACPARSSFIFQYIVGKPVEFDGLDEAEAAELMEKAFAAVPSHLMTELLRKTMDARRVQSSPGATN